MIKVGLVVNPVAGMGGSVGLKGTDGDMYNEALKRGATPVTPVRIREVLSLVTRDDLYFLTSPGKMGEDYLKNFKFQYTTIGERKETTTPQDTRQIAGEMISEGISLLIFAGGDGTARDIMDAVGDQVPVIAIPAGVKMFSPVFSLSAHSAAKMIDTFNDEFIKKEVLDIDEEAFRDNRLVAKLYGYLKVPNISNLLQGKKAPSNTKAQAEDIKKDVARSVREAMEKHVLYLLGPGTTVDAIAKELGIQKTLLGIDAIYDDRLVGTDISETDILKLIQTYGKTKIIVTPIGGNGFIFGRGSKQISSRVLEQIDREDILIVGTPDKILTLPCLRVDSGDYNVDKKLSGIVNVVIGYNEEVVMEVQYD